jgi:putative ABC transport system substrate-binding protein
MAAHMAAHAVLIVVVLVMSGVPYAANAAGASEDPVVGVLLYTNREVHSPADRAFRQALTDLGYEEGRNLSVVYRWADKDTARLREAAIELVQIGVDGLMVIYGIDTHEHRTAIAEEAMKHRLPAIGAESFATAGGLLSYGTEAYATWRRAAEYVSKILRGATPGELPIEQESRVLLVVNLRTAKRLNLAMPMSLTLQADEIIR